MQLCVDPTVVYNTTLEQRTPTTPTEEAYTELQQAYDFFNRQLFAGQLPPCLITMQRHQGSYGYFSGNRWANHVGTVRDEIAMNPVYFASRSVTAVLSTLVHEMVHLWQHHCGTPSRAGYHNTEWADKMTSVGLIPSHTGLPGGKRTGQQMTHYIQEGGPFARVCEQLLTQGFLLSWHDRMWDAVGAGGGGRKGTLTPRSTRSKYTCPACGVNAWAKPHIVLVCGVCHAVLTTLEQTKDDS